MTCMPSGGFGVVLLAAGIIIASGGCGASSPTGPTTTTAAVGPTSAFCQALKEASGSDQTLTSKAAWDQRLALTATLVALAPPAQQANAQVYLQLVADRVHLASQYNYVSVQQWPADARNTFIADHQSQQAQSNIFIDYATTTCNMA
ncbi:MAG: hypothetical protein ABL971_08400 [Vicinamibacterales bacterium]